MALGNIGCDGWYDRRRPHWIKDRWISNVASTQLKCWCRIYCTKNVTCLALFHRTVGWLEIGPDMSVIFLVANPLSYSCQDFANVDMINCILMSETYIAIVFGAISLLASNRCRRYPPEDRQPIGLGLPIISVFYIIVPRATLRGRNVKMTTASNDYADSLRPMQPCEMMCTIIEPISLAVASIDIR